MKILAFQVVPCGRWHEMVRYHHPDGLVHQKKIKRSRDMKYKSFIVAPFFYIKECDTAGRLVVLHEVWPRYLPAFAAPTPTAWKSLVTRQ